jgi:FMN-dependent NADH-azoreductase
MTHVLHIDSSIFSDQGVSSTLAGEYVAALRRREPGLQVRHRNLARDPVPHLDEERLTAMGTPPESRTDRQQRIAAEADTLTRELQQADILVLGVPMYNFAVPTQLKAWLDHVARAGVTFRYTEKGPEGLLEGKRAVIFTSRGGLHRGLPSDSQTAFLTTLLGLLGIDDVQFVYAEGLNMGDSRRREGLAAAKAALHQLAAA